MGFSIHYMSFYLNLHASKSHRFSMFSSQHFLQFFSSVLYILPFFPMVLFFYGVIWYMLNCSRTANKY